MSEPSRIDEYPVIRSVSTHVIKYGVPESTGQSQLALVIPGNPGAIEFYDEFMKHLHNKTGWPVWGLSHAGHSAIPQEHWKEPEESVFTFEGQIQHKVTYVKKHLPSNVKLILIGHSIGSYIVLEVMDRLESDLVVQGFLLFPTIERMADSPQGSRMTPLLRNWRWLCVLIVAGLSVLPNSWKSNLVNYWIERRKHLLKGPLAPCIPRGALHLFDPYCVSKATYMAHQEMQQVSDLDERLLERHLDKLHFYYGASDHWCPQEYFNDMRERYPTHKHLYLCQEGHRHAFIIDSSEPMASILTEWIKSL